MFRIVEVIHDTGITVPVGFDCPAPSVLEDTDSGIRMLVLSEPKVASVHYQRLIRSVGAVAFYDGTWNWMLSDAFIASSTPRGDYIFSSYGWNKANALPTYRTMKSEAYPIGYAKGYASLHVHSEFSAFDGLSKVDEIVAFAADNRQPAIAITDHGTCAGHFALQTAAERAGIKPIFGVEAYFVDDRHDRERRAYDYQHLCLWAQDDEGLRNLWAMSTEAHREGFHGKPTLDWDTLSKYAEGVMCGTACLSGPVAKHLLYERDELARHGMARLLSIFGDRLYAELHTNGLDEQVVVNSRLLNLAHDMSVPTIAVTDSHYLSKDTKTTHQAWVAMTTNSDLQDDAGVFQGDHDYHMMTEEEVRASLSYLPSSAVDEAIANTVSIASSVSARIKTSNAVPVYSKEGGADRDRDRLMELCLSAWKTRGLPDMATEQGQRYASRFESEMRLLIDKKFCGYFLMVADYTKWAKDSGILVGPGRGSGGGSLVAYLSGITEIDPIEADLLFERFLTAGRDSLPDFDIDFPATKRDLLQAHLRERWGDDYVVRVGTHLRLKSKGVIRKLASTLKNTINIDFRDIELISSIIDQAEEDTSGLGHSWEDLWEDYADTPVSPENPFTLRMARAKYPLLFTLADGMVSRLHSYGKHAAGFVISTNEPIVTNTPLRVGEDDGLVTEFDMTALEPQGFVKFDMLTLRTLDTIQQTIDLIQERHGKRISVYDWNNEYDDPRVWDDLSDGHVIGVFQVEKVAGQKMCERLKPRSIGDLADVITLIRPGPARSGLTDMYLRRRHEEEPVVYPHPDLSSALGRTYGAMIYQEDIMAVCSIIAGYDLNEADEVRRILGKKKLDKVKEEGDRFVRRAVERGYDMRFAERLWEQMAEFARYSFNRAHAWGYALLGYWTAWLKVNYPVEFLTAVLSTVPKERVPDFVREAKRLGIAVLPPDINESKKGFTPTSNAVRYGIDSVKGIADAAADSIIERQPYGSWAEFKAWTLDRKCRVNIGHIETLAKVGAFDSLYPNRKALEMLIEEERSGKADYCVFRDDKVVGPNGLPCVFDWDSEPTPVTPTGKPTRRKPIPKRCTKACRQYVQKSPIEPASVVPYTASDVRDREKEMLGVWLSSSPFDDIPDDYWHEASVKFSALDGKQIQNAQQGTYCFVGLLSKRKSFKDKNGNTMAFLGFETRDGTCLDVVCFSKDWSRLNRTIQADLLYTIVVEKNSRGQSLKQAIPIS